jgi:hypothetical protein
LFDEIKRLDIVNSEKHTREVIELKEQISQLKDRIAISRATTENDVKD